MNTILPKTNPSLSPRTLRHYLPLSLFLLGMLVPTLIILFNDANNSFAYVYNQTGTITFNNTTFGDLAPGVVKSGYFTRANSLHPMGSLSNTL